MDFLEKVVLGEIRRLTKLATQYESEFAKIVMGHSIQTAQQERRQKQKEIKKREQRKTPSAKRGRRFSYYARDYDVRFIEC